MRSFLSALLALPVILAFDIRGKIDFDPSNATIPTQSRIVLDYRAKSAFVRQDGSFQISGVDDGQHVLEILVPGYTFSQYLVTIPGPHVQHHHPSRQSLPTSSPSLPYPLVIRPMSQDDYFSSPGGMNVLGLLKNPMALMMLFSAVMMYALPKMMSSMDIDPEMAKEMAETRKKMQGMQNMDWTGSLSTMLAGGSEETTVAATTPSTTMNGTPKGGNGNSSGNGKKRRGR